VKNIEEEPKEYFERNIFLVVIVAVSGFFLDWLSITLLLDVNPWGTATAIPGLMLTLQGIWLIVNPFAIVYQDRFEIKQSLLYNKEFYYLDAKSIDDKKTQSVQLIYNDGDLENLHLLGMRAAHKQLFNDRLKEKIAESVKHRDF
jgi:hypothetical protein